MATGHSKTSKPKSSARKRLFKIVLPSVIVLLTAEAALRVVGIAPSGRFNFMLPAGSGHLYPPNETIENVWGLIPYTVTTDEFGLRGNGVLGSDTPGRTRIVTIGDSVTDGFSVDNDGTFQHTLQTLLDGEFGDRYRVLNAARGGGSIDKEFAILKGLALPLRPATVILTFCTNDVADLRNKTREQLLNAPVPFDQEHTSWFAAAAMAMFTKTAIGEMVYRAYWHNFVLQDAWPVPDEPDDRSAGRYEIAGGADFEANAATFRQRFARADCIVLDRELAEEARTLLDHYLAVLDAFAARCDESGAALVFVYFPCYVEIYEGEAAPTVRRLLAEHCQRLGVPFLDLTEALRREGQKRVIHLAPLDYHPSPAGNEIVGRTIFGFLREQDLVRQEPR